MQPGKLPIPTLHRWSGTRQPGAYVNMNNGHNTPSGHVMLVSACKGHGASWMTVSLGSREALESRNFDKWEVAFVFMNYLTARP